MTTTIGTVTLDRDMIFSNEYDYSLIKAEVTPTIGGGIVVQEFLVSESGRLIALVSTDSQGMQLKSTIDALMALSALPNQTHVLSIVSNNKTFSKTIRFVNETQGGAVQFVPFQVRDGIHSDDIWYKGSIFMMVV